MQEPASARLLVDAVAVDRQGRPVTDLKQEDVEVWIGHFRVPIESFSRRRQHRRSISIGSRDGEA